MTNPLKVITTTQTSIIVLVALGYFGFQQFIRSIYSQRSCEWANIDNIEMHAGVDIPKITKCDCEYVKSRATKMAWFDIDKGNIDLTNYTRANNFKKLNSTAGVSFDDLLIGETNVDALKGSSDLYYTKGSSNGETWQMVLDHSSGRLWVTIRYGD